MHTMSRTGILMTFGMLIVGIISGCSDNPPEEVKEPLQSEDDIKLPSAITVMVDPAPRPGVFFYTNTEFTPKFNKEVLEVTVNDTPAVGSGLNWKWSAFPGLPYGSVTLKIRWRSRDGSKGFATRGPYEVADNGGEPPEITHSTVADGAISVDPAPINAVGLRIDFDEDVTGTIKLTDEAGNDLKLDWTRGWLNGTVDSGCRTGTCQRNNLQD